MMMATFSPQIFITALLVSFFGVQVDCHVERYAFNVVEKGTKVNEEIDVNVEEQTEVIRVPKHNDVAASDVLNDFASGLSARRVPSTQDCFVSKLDPSIPPPQKMKLDLDQASKQRIPDKVEIVKSITRELGFANRSALPQKILDFCGSFPIYNVEEIPLGSNNAQLSKTQGQGRKKRNHIQTEYHMCSSADEDRLEKCQNKYGFNFNLKCRFKTATCFYITMCSHIGAITNRKYQCKGVIHHYKYRGFCCEALCKLT